MRTYSIRPVSRQFGFDRGQPIDRYFIDRFLDGHRDRIKGDVLEIGENRYTSVFGTREISLDLMDISERPGVSIIADLETGEGLPVERYDCFILTQVIHLLYDVKKSLEHAMQVLKPGGSLLVTVPGMSKSCKTDEYGDYWRFTSLSLSRLMDDIDGVDSVDVYSYGNLATAQAFLDGRAAHELPRKFLAFSDPQYEVLLAAHVIKQKAED